MSWVAVAVGTGVAGAGIGGAVLSSGAASDAAGIQAQALRDAAGIQANSTTQALNALAPFRNLGASVIPSLLAYYVGPQYFKLANATKTISPDTYTPDQLSQTYGDLTQAQTFINQGPHGGRGLFGQIANDPKVPLGIRNIAQQYLAKQNATTVQDEGSTSYGFNDPSDFAAQIKSAIDQQNQSTTDAQQRITDLLGGGNGTGTGTGGDGLSPSTFAAQNLPPDLPPELLQALSVGAATPPPIPQSLTDALNTPAAKFTPTPYKETDRFRSAFDLGERYLNRDLAARGLYSSGAGTQALSDFVSKLVRDDSQTEYQNQLAQFSTNQDAFNQYVQRQSAGYNAQVGAFGLTQDAKQQNINRLSDLYGLKVGAFNLGQGQKNTEFSRLLALLGIGSGTAGQSANLIQQGGTAQAGLTSAIGQANAAGTLGSAQAWSGALNDLGKTGSTLGLLYGLGAFGKGNSTTGGQTGGGSGGYSTSPADTVNIRGFGGQPGLLAPSPFSTYMVR